MPRNTKMKKKQSLPSSGLYVNGRGQKKGIRSFEDVS